MDLNYSDDERAFQSQVRSFLKEKLPAHLSEKVRLGTGLTKADMEEWHAILNAQGWLAQNWPKEFGGAEWNAVQRHIFEEEAALANAPRIVPFGLSMLAPVLQKFASKEQCDTWLPRILDGTDWWCQGYSEPGAGSDLASLKTRAVREGDHYVVNGQKTWTTLGQHANMIFCLVRTNTEVKQQEGISFLLIDMDTPGIEVRPIVLLDGGAEVNEIWFTDVKVPVENLVGEENKGWTYAKYLLTHERTGTANVGNNTTQRNTAFNAHTHSTKRKNAASGRKDRASDGGKTNGPDPEPEPAQSGKWREIGLPCAGQNHPRLHQGKKRRHRYFCRLGVRRKGRRIRHGCGNYLGCGSSAYYRCETPQ